MLIGGLSVILSGICFFTLRVAGGDVFPPPLGAEEEAKCFRLLAQGDLAARDRLIRHNLRLVAHIIKKYYSGCRDQEDLISIGTIGLIKAIDSFKPENGTKFATYAGKCLQNEILMYFRAQKKLGAETSINDAIEYDKDGNPLTYMDVACVEDDIAETIDLKMRSTKAMEGVGKLLDGRERSIMIRRYGLDGRAPLTQREVAARMGISRSYVSRLEKCALEKLRAFMEDKG